MSTSPISNRLPDVRLGELSLGTVKGQEFTQSKVRPTTVSGQTIPRLPKEVRQEARHEMPNPQPLGHHLARTALESASRVFQSITSRLKEAGQAVIGYFQREKLPSSLRMTMPPNGTAFNLDTKCLPSRLPTGMTVEQFKTQLQAKINNGYNLVRDLSSGNVPNRACTAEDTTNIVWFLQAQGEKKIGQSFEQGAFSIPDPGGHIQQFLDSCPEAYQRFSSHLDDIQGQQGCKHRGIDSSGSTSDLAHLLPHGMQTLLYGKLPKGEGTRLPEQRLYLKIEEHGCYMSKPKGGRDVGGPTRPMNRHDVGAFLGHIGTTIPSLFRKLLGRGEGEGTFKERLPPELKNGFKALQRDAPPEVQEILGRGGPMSKSGGVRVMLGNIDAVLQDNALHVSQELRGRLEQFKTEHLSGRNGLDHPECRFGEEIILTANELTQGVKLVPKENFSPQFAQEWSNRVNEQLGQDLQLPDRFTPQGLNEQCLLDTFREGYKFGGQEIRTPEQLQSFFTGENGIRDAKIVTTVVNQAFLAPSQVIGATTNLGPFQGVLNPVPHSEHHDFNVTRLNDGSYRVDFQYEVSPSMFNSMEGQQRRLDPQTSEFSMSGSIRIRPGGNPVVTFEQPPQYGLKLEETQ